MKLVRCWSSREIATPSCGLWIASLRIRRSAANSGCRGQELARVRHDPVRSLARLYRALVPLVKTATVPEPAAGAALRVLHIHSGNLYGGVETVLTTLAKSRAECRGMESSFALCFDGRLSDELEAIGAAVYRLNPVRFSRPWTVWQARRRLVRLLASKKFDVAVCHGCWGYALAAGTLKRHRVPVAFWLHDIPSGTHWLERLASRWSPDLVLANSHFTAGLAPKLFPGAGCSAILSVDAGNGTGRSADGT